MTGGPQHPLGATPLPGGRCRFLVYAPFCRSVEVRLLSPEERAIRLEKDDSGYHHGIADRVAAGALYFYRLDGGVDRPDPASRRQPRGVHGPSMVVDLERSPGGTRMRGSALSYFLYETARRDVHGEGTSTR
jgi:maltooligosyltrehalose trehalohydrolase